MDCDPHGLRFPHWVVNSGMGDDAVKELNFTTKGIVAYVVVTGIISAMGTIGLIKAMEWLVRFFR